MNKIKKLFKGRVGSVISYSLIKYIALAIGFLKGLVNARVLGPELLGVLGNLILILGYCGYANLGITNSMNREYVVYEDDNKEKAESVLNTSFTFLVYLSLLFIIFSIISFYMYKNTYGIYLSLVFVIAIFEQFKNFFTSYFRLKDDYEMINKIEVIYNIILFALTVLLIFNWKILGVLVAMLLCDIVIMYIGIKNMERVKIQIEKDILKALISLGVPLLIYNLGFYILTTIDRLIIIKYYTNEALGYYTFANTIVTATLVFITSFLFLLYPKALKTFNEKKSNGISEKLFFYTKILELGCVLLFIMGLIGITPFIYLLLPKYEASIVIYNILVLAVIMNYISYFANTYIASNKKQMYLVYLQIISIILNFTLNIIFVKLGFGVIGVVVGTLITNTIYSFIQYMIFLKLNTKKMNFRKTYIIYRKIIIFSAIQVILVLLKVNYLISIISTILITLVFYFNDIKNIKNYIRYIKD
ncbi:lipopolysaccharide biosynthesis protein [Clostridium beijerinckii]|uniref:lipopolysaccharide biosynthesis protein n=1 Tax=Clostridium beijerinckii TaxID=1520 RepID=UPI00232FCA75|nr:oligosaccharide flippase family protein [Clostridium beijerinckii]